MNILYMLLLIIYYILLKNKHNSMNILDTDHITLMFLVLNNLSYINIIQIIYNIICFSENIIIFIIRSY